MATIKSYGYKPRIHFFVCDDEDLDSTFTFGFENETEMLSDEDADPDDFVRNQITLFLTERFRDDFTSKELIYFKHDGSLRNGCEVVSQPMSYKWFLNHKNDFKDFFSLMNELGFSSHDGGRCGLHFHIGKNQMGANKLSNTQTVKDEQTLFVAENMNMLLNYYQLEFTAFSRRTNKQIERWCAFSDKLQKNFVKNKSEYVKKNIKHGGSAGRYKALNLTNEKTIEFRLLRGTLKFDTFFYSFNLVNNLVNFSTQEHKLVRFENLLTDGLSEEEKNGVLKYMNKEKNLTRYEGFEYRENPIFTNRNSYIRDRQSNNYLKSLGLL